MKFKIPFLMIFGVLLLIAGACGITGCSSGGGDGAPATAVTDTDSGDTVDDSGLPPDPGETGKATLAGIDSDGDGVRDDVQRYIALTYPDSEKVRTALTQYAISLQNALIDADDKEKSIQHAEESDRAGSCLWYVLGSLDERIKVRNNLILVMLNTDERNRAYFTYNDQLGGEVFNSVPYDERSSSCEFDISSLPN